MAQKVGKSLSRLGNRNLIVFILFGIKETNEVEKAQGHRGHGEDRGHRGHGEDRGHRERFKQLNNKTKKITN